jgi:hypothetical protein
MTNPNDLAELTQAARELVERVNALHSDTGDTIEGLAQRSATNRRWIRVIVVGFVLNIILTIIVAVGGMQVARNNARIDAVTQRLDDAQTTQRAKALCPLYQVFLDFERFPPPNQSAEQIAARVQAYKTIHASYDVLGCKDLLAHK